MKEPLAGFFALKHFKIRMKYPHFEAEVDSAANFEGVPSKSMKSVHDSLLIHSMCPVKNTE